MLQKLIGLWTVLLLAGCAGPDATALLSGDGADLDDVESVEGALTSSSRADRWWPMAEGNTWVFASERGARRTVRLSYVGGGMALLSGLFADDVWIGVGAAKNTLLAWDWDKGEWVPFVRFGYARTTWKYGDQPCTGLKMKRAATGVVVDTGAGSFSDTRVIAAEQLPDPLAFCRPPAFNELSFAAGQGLVAFRTGLGERFALQHATVGGRQVPGGVTATLTLDRASYESLPNTIVCITTPCPGNAVTAKAEATFTVKNESSQAVTWRFASGCQHDVELVLPTGEVVKRLSQGRACTMALSQLTLAPGAQKSWTSTVDLEDSTGLQLDGDFVARGVLLSREGQAVPSPTAAFSVRVVQ